MKARNKFSLVGALATVLLGLSIANGGLAYRKSFSDCNGALTKWRGDIDLHRQQFSINTTDKISAYFNGFTQWNQYSGIITPGDLYVRPMSDQTFDSADNGQNEMSMALRSEIDGLDGKAFVQADICGIGANDIDEGDIVIAVDLPDGTPMHQWKGWGDDIRSNSGNYGRTAWVHEFGHFFGFAHQDDAAATLSQMRTSGMGAITGGPEAATVWGTDVQGMNAFYGMPGSKANLLPSSTMVASFVGASIITLDPAVTYNTCRNRTQSVTFAIANAGEANAVNFNVRVRMNNINPSNGGYTNSLWSVFTGGFTANAFNRFFTTISFTVPANLSAGLYWIYIDLDTSNAIPEWLDTDNTTVSAKRLNVIVDPIACN